MDDVAGPECLEALHRMLGELWAGVEVDAAQRGRFTTALAELVANVVEHGRRPDGSPPHLRVELTAGAEALEGRLVDDGVAVPAAPVTGMPDPHAESGRGLALAMRSADELDYRRAGAENLWRVAVRRVRSAT